MSALSACVITWETSLSVLGRRVIKPSDWRLVALSSLYNLESATKYRGVGERWKVLIRAAARSWKIWVSEVLPSQLWLIKGTPPSCETISSKTACFKSGRWSLE